MDRSRRPHSFSRAYSQPGLSNWAERLSFGSYCAPICAPLSRSSHVYQGSFLAPWIYPQSIVNTPCFVLTGVTWKLVSQPSEDGFECPFHDISVVEGRQYERSFKVCRPKGQRDCRTRKLAYQVTVVMDLACRARLSVCPLKTRLTAVSWSTLLRISATKPPSGA
jgi:hypothetical protein